MSNLINLARPYARAAFEYALKHRELSQWSPSLTKLAKMIREPNVAKLLKNPKFTTTQLAEITLALLGEKNSVEIENFIKLLAENRRLTALPAIAKLFAEYHEENERILNVQVTSVVELTEDARKKIIEMLNKKIGRSIKLHCDLNPHLMGGLVIRAGDLVIDASVRGQLERLRADLIN